ncbi:MATE family efflux transporter [Sphingomicrobium aestuariivivum]|uniref:MATE family efflux transporter n=1 Tax=Sphingomicrobium aestuariivivum TaxID=1582356 RepID=UPI001FD664EF|nr:MATE family efflux transporter [Sphingomicrobium aestuariivivum]MCJ8190687.1 MATE family efflux transporter [Sphingomicrobium aestuariivivum]
MPADSPPRKSAAAKLATGSIPGHLLTQTLPMMVGGAALMSVGIIDAYFVGQLGADALAAISFIFPVTVALSSLGVGVIAGISSVVSRALGQGDEDLARRRGNMGIVLAALFGVAIGLGLYAGRHALFRLMQADEAILPLIDAYMGPFALFFPLLLVSMGVNGCLRGQGLAKRSSSVLLALAVANWVLDPLLITGAFGVPGMGIAGAAWATVGGWAVAVLVGFLFLQKSALPFSPRTLPQCDWKGGSRAIARVAGPAAFSNSINPIGLSVLTGFLAATAGEAAVAGFGTGGRLQSFAVVPLLSLSASIGAIVGQNWGAGELGRVRQALVWAGGFCIAYGLVIGAVLVGFRETLAGLFTDDPEVIAAMGDYLMIAAWGYAGYGVLIMANGALNALDFAGNALVQSVARVLLVMVPVAWWLGGKWGANGIYAAELAANLFGGLVAAAMLWWVVWKRPQAD